MVILESMKMEHVVGAPARGKVVSLAVAPGASVAAGAPLAVIEATTATDPVVTDDLVPDLDTVRPDLAEVQRRQALVLDGGRPDVVERRHAGGRRTARENIDDLCDPGSFVEYGSLAIAAQRGRRPEEELIERTPADGLVAGVGRVNGDRFDGRPASCAVLSYDYTVLAGTQGQQNHRKKDRLFELIERLRLPVVLFAEGGGGRPGDTDYAVITGLDTTAFARFGALSGLVPHGRYRLGMVLRRQRRPPRLLRRDHRHHRHIDRDGRSGHDRGRRPRHLPRPRRSARSTCRRPTAWSTWWPRTTPTRSRLAKQYLSYFQGRDDRWTCADQRLLAQLRAREPAAGLCHRRPDRHPGRHRFGAGAPGRIRPGDGHRPDPDRGTRRSVWWPTTRRHLGGAIDSDGADKAARFLQLCDAHDIPILFLCDTPGFMVGPEAEQTGQVRHFSRLFVIGASLTVPFFTIVLRKGYGLGAQAMAGGSFRSPLFVVAWPTGELGGMGLEGAVRLGFRRELEAVDDPAERGGALRAHGRPGLPAREGAERGHRLRDRRRDRPGRLEAEGRRCSPVGAAAATTQREEAELYRHLVISRAVGAGGRRRQGDDPCPGPPPWGSRW